MRGVGVDLQARLDTGATTMCRCWLVVRRDGARFGFTDHDRDLAIDGDVYKAGSGLDASVIEASTGLSVDNGQAVGALSYVGLTEGEMETILKEEMINLIAQGLSVRFLNQIENQVADSLGLDEFKIETIFKKEQDSDLAFFPGLSLETLAFKAGKYFSENFYLTYSAPLFEMGIGDLGLE